jgi:hypothetical protein
MADEVYFRLIVTGPGKGDLMVVSRAIRAILQAFQDNIPNFNLSEDLEPFSGAMNTGLPFHVPFSFEEDAAREFRWQLEAAGCAVRVTDVGA